MFKPLYWKEAYGIVSVEIEKHEESQFIRIDDYWLKVMMAFIDKGTGKSKYNILFNFAMCVLSLSHGNSDPERGFSINKFLLDTHGNSISEVTIECIRLLKDFLVRKRGLENVDINKQMMKSCKSSHERYQLDLAAKRKQKLEEALSNAKKTKTVKEAEKAANSKKNEEQKKEIDEIWNYNC